MENPEKLRHDMVERQIEARGVTNPAVLNALREVPRENFVPDNLVEFTYEDGPLLIGEDQTISQPFIVASMIDAAEIEPTDRILEVGAGSGYAAAVLSRIAVEVFGVERFETLTKAARERVEALGYENCHIVAGDGMEGLQDEAPFDAILVAAHTDEVPPALKQQLAIGGRLIIPLGNDHVQRLTCIIRQSEDDWESHEIAPVRFVPLLPGTIAEKGTRSASNDEASRNKTTQQRIAEAARLLS